MNSNDGPISVTKSFSRGDVFARPCPSREILNHVSSRWGVLILIALDTGTYRFSALRKRIDGVSEKMLAQNLQQLARHGLVKRISYPVVPPHVEYSLTPLGKELAAHVVALADWIELNLDKITIDEPEAVNEPNQWRLCSKILGCIAVPHDEPSA